MDLERRRAEFSVMYVDLDFQGAASFVERLQNAGYQPKYFPSTASVLGSIKDDPPHFVIYNYESGEQLCESFLLDLAALSQEILPILLVGPNHLGMASRLKSAGRIFNFAQIPPVNEVEFLEAIDGAARSWLEKLRVEQLSAPPLDETALPPPPPEPDPELEAVLPKESAPQVQPPIEPAMHFSSLEALLQRLKPALDVEDVVQEFMQHLCGEFESAVLYFRYHSAHSTLVLQKTAGIPEEAFQGLGLNLKEMEPKQIPQCLHQPTQWTEFCEMLQQVFHVTTFSAWPHLFNGQVRGIFVILNAVRVRPMLPVEAQIFELAYQRSQIAYEKLRLQTVDPVSGLFYREHFLTRMHDEVSRARRVRLPLSLVLVSLDQFDQWRKSLAPQQVEGVLRAIGRSISKKIRVSDVAGRLTENEFGLLLPHTAFQGGTIKAEHIRRSVEEMAFEVLSSWPLRASLSVCEYQTMSRDADSLMTVGLASLAQAKAKGNSVVLAAPPKGYQPEFGSSFQSLRS